MLKFDFQARRIFNLMVVMSAFLLWVSCDDSDRSSSSTGGDTPIDEEPVSEDFILMQSAGKSVLLGTDAESALANERPQMQVNFDYDFRIQKHEVTCGEYAALAKLHGECENDSLPVTDVNYLDAILYANEKSKQEKLDTVYSYVSARFNEKGFCSGLEGLVFRPDVEGYRLPTEAEWVYAANSQWNVENSWTADDGIDAPQKVCSKVDSLLCDMEGNVSEWVNDWLGSFREGSVTDFAGALNGGSLGERIIKGGSYRNQGKSVNSYSRGDVYVVTSTSHEVYVGFRLVLGAIPSAEWLSEDGSAQSRTASPLASSSTLRAFSGAYHGKLVFRNGVTKNLTYIDYANARLPVMEFKDTLNVYHPEISPNGVWVAFCTGLEGVSGKSSVFVRELKTDSLVKLDVESAAIPRWRVLENGDTVVVYVTDAGDNSDKVTFLKESTWQVKFSGRKFGTPEKLFDGAYHSGVDGNFAVSGSKLLRVHVGDKDTSWYGDKQICNVSLSKGGDKRVLFLDFGNKKDSDFAKEAYGVHERILIADSTGKILQSIPSPEGYSFDHTEWVSDDLIIATVTNNNGRHLKILAVRPSDSNMVELMEGDELWHPSLWLRSLDIEVDESLDLDSAAVYSIESGENIYLQYKIPTFWQRKDSLEIVGLGNSHMSTGFCAKMLPHAFDMATVPCDGYCSRYLVENYLLNHAPNLKYIILGVDFDLWMNDSTYSMNASLGDAPGFKYDRDHNFWKDGLPKGFVEIASNGEVERDNYQKTFDAFDGQLAIMSSNGWYDEDGTSEIVGRDWDTRPDQVNNAEGNYRQILKTIQLAKEKGIYVVGVVFPISPYYKTTDQYGRHGLRRTTAEKYLELLQEKSDAEKYFVLFDENKMGDHDYTSDMAYDYDHLNYVGSRTLTKRLMAVLDTLK